MTKLKRAGMFHQEFNGWGVHQLQQYCGVAKVQLEDQAAEIKSLKQETRQYKSKEDMIRRTAEYPPEYKGIIEVLNVEIYSPVTEVESNDN